MPFRVQGKNFSLTYSNVQQQGWHEFTKEDLLNYLKTLEHSSYALVCEEKHENGETHFHALVQFSKKRDIRNQRYFDYGNCHPNIQVTRNVKEWMEYCKKDGDYIEDGSPPYVSLVDQCKAARSKLDWLEHCVNTGIPFGYCQEMWGICHSERDVVTLDEGEEYEGAIEERLSDFEYDFGSKKSLVLIGTSGCGKTTWAKRRIPKPALFITHIDQLKHLGPEHKGIIFDDMVFKHIPTQGQIHLVDQYNANAIHRRYGTTTLPAGLPRVFTCNEDPLDLQYPAIARRVRVVRIN